MPCRDGVSSNRIARRWFAENTECLNGELAVMLQIHHARRLEGYHV